MDERIVISVVGIGYWFSNRMAPCWFMAQRKANHGIG